MGTCGTVQLACKLEEFTSCTQNNNTNIHIYNDTTIFHEKHEHLLYISNNIMGVNLSPQLLYKHGTRERDGLRGKRNGMLMQCGI